MSLKQEIETWVAALGHYDNNEFDEALREFDGIADTSKILFNCGVIHATLGEHEKAVECYQKAVRLDQYLAVAYFQQGVSNFLVGDFEEALANFNDTLLYLRGNNMIDYAQLGLMFKLYSCEVLFNRGLCYIYLQQKDAGMQDFSFAVKEKVVEDHNVIDDAIREEAEGYTVFSIPVGVVYRPNQAKVKNLKTKDYLGKARLVAASDRNNAFTGFAGSEIKNAGKLDVKDDRPQENLSYAATNLVKPGLQSKASVPEPQSFNNRGPPGGAFPPTPPPENERSAPSQMSRGASVRNGPKPMPARLNMDRARPNERYDVRDARSPPQRMPTQRMPSEPRGPPARSNTNGSTQSRAPSRRPDNRRRAEDEDDAYPDELYDMYSTPNRNSRRSNGNRRTQSRYEDEDEYASEYDDGSFDEGDFEMVSKANPPPRSRAASSTRGQSRKPDIRKIRVKVHSEDVRYIMIGAAVEFPDLVDRIRDKFGLRKRFKIKVRDEDTPNGDMITMGDQDDLDMVLMSVKANARREKADMGKMEIWIVEV
ncbi:tetratricopeptide-2 [Coleophoma cylindrospora]|uniref:Tetratricopeptide-2 n=1 Tax=Coleophoma cylindrospora TaxID=1849047 RepID=A0A3D8SSQ7_9HELO|nr:tetratricopeptide-2 [Coleophoma cylindrospora]